MSETASHTHTEIRTDSLGELSRITLSNGTVAAQFLPEIGGKMISLVRLESGHEFLLKPLIPDRSYRRAHWGAAFEDFDTSGFDECVPTVSACRYPDVPYVGQPLPDHGELWSTKWQHEIDERLLLMVGRGDRLPYQLSKRITLAGSVMTIAYEMRNLSEVPLRYLWSAHPLLSVEAGSRIVLPPEVNRVFLNWSRGGRLGSFGDILDWPGPMLDVVEGPSRKTADKLFTPHLTFGYCALYKPRSRESITFRFDHQLIQYLGIWICQGGWPEKGSGHFTIALEPCNGFPDSLEQAIARGTATVLPAASSHRWQLSLQLQEGPPQLSSATPSRINADTNVTCAQTSRS